MSSSALQRFTNSNVDWLTQSGTATWYCLNLHTKILDNVHHTCHHVTTILIKESRRLETWKCLFDIWLEDHSNQITHHMFIHPGSILACIQIFTRVGWEFTSLNPCTRLTYKIIIGCRKWPEAVAVTDTVTCHVDDNVVRPLTVRLPGALSVLPLNMSKFMGIWSMLITNAGCRFGPTIFFLAYSMKSRASLWCCSGGRWHSCVTARSTILFEAKNRHVIWRAVSSFGMLHWGCKPSGWINEQKPWSLAHKAKKPAQ